VDRPRLIGLARAVAGWYAASYLAIAAVSWALPLRNGPAALANVLAPHLALPLVAALPLVGRRAALPTVLVITALILTAIRFLPGVLSLPAATPPNYDELRVMTWNLETGLPSADDVRARLRATDADVVALQELTPHHAAAITSDAELRARFGYRALYPVQGAAGVGILSRYPIAEVEHGDRPFFIQLLLSVPSGPPVIVINAHPFPASIPTVTPLRIPLGLDATSRDAEIRALSERVGVAVKNQDPIILIGDFNVTDRERAYTELAGGLHDAHLEVGLGTGSTWRPDRLKQFPFGVLRIDYVMTGGGIVPVKIGEDCTPLGSDHCIVAATLAVPRGD
jgi:vancomycin resistance protein VanJ